MSEPYETHLLRKPICMANLGRHASGLYSIFGSDLSRRENLALIDDHIVLYASGNCVVFEDMTTSFKEYLLAIDEGGIGCIAVHPSRKYFAVGGKGNQPRIAIYSYPDMLIRKVLNGGAEKGFASLTFNCTGLKLASVAMAPDYMLTVWDWEEEKIALHAKAFGQDVFTVRFSLDDEKRLTTCGTGHIRFWKMASTFTGLKLQGSIGKFGKVELTDIAAFVELPDGKVLSGTENGSLLLWEGNFIKCRFTQLGGTPCHIGEITFIDYDRKEGYFITAGHDGFIKWWSFESIDSAEVDSDHSMDFELVPVAVYSLPYSAAIKTLIDGGEVAGGFRSLVVFDDSGRTQSIKFSLAAPAPADEEVGAAPVAPTEGDSEIPCSINLKFVDVIQQHSGENVATHPEIIVLGESHSKTITGLDTSPLAYLAVTCSLDGTVRLWDFLQRHMLAMQSFASPPTALRWLPLELDQSASLFAVGFADGCVRIFGIEETDFGDIVFSLKMVFKPHNAAVTDISFNESAVVMATTAKDGIIFFINCHPLSSSNKIPWKPLRFVNISGLPLNTAGGGKSAIICEKLSWSTMADFTIMCSCNDGILRELNITDMVTEAEAGKDEEIKSFEALVPIKDIPLMITTAMLGSSSMAQLSLGNDSKEGENVAATTTTTDTFVTCKVFNASYTRSGHLNEIILCAQAGSKTFLFQGATDRQTPSEELALGLYSSDGKEYAKTPLVTCSVNSWSKNFIVLGTNDGSVVVRPAHHVEVFVRMMAHNGQCGGVTATALSFDDRFVLSGGHDGLLVINRLRLDLVEADAQRIALDISAGVYQALAPQTKPPEPEPKYMVQIHSSPAGVEKAEEFDLQLCVSLMESLPSMAGSKNTVPDIAAGSYSIQDAKLKSEEDAKAVTADELKEKVRAAIKSLQKEYDNVRKQNEKISSDIRLPYDRMCVDGEFLVTLRKKRESAIEEVNKDCAYEAERAVVLRKKVTDTMMNGLLTEEIKLSAFVVTGCRQPVSFVNSLRTQGVDSSVQEILDAIKSMVRVEQLEEAQNKANDIARKNAILAVDEMKDRKHKKEEVVQDNHSVHSKEDPNSKKEKANCTSAQARLDMRRKRKELLSSHDQKKPKEDEDDIRDLATIQLAEKTVGDYKLKGGDNYEVPEDQRINATKKKRQMALLEESMVSMRLQFNDRFLALRELKRQIVYSIRRDNIRIGEIDAELQQPHLSRSLWTPLLDPAEYPDDRDEISASELKAYQAVRASLGWEKAQPPTHSIVTGTKTIVTKNIMTSSYGTAQKPTKSVQEYQQEKGLSDPKLVDYLPPREDAAKYYEINDTVLGQYASNSQQAAAIAELENIVPVLRVAKLAKKKLMFFSKQTPSQTATCSARSRLLQFERKMLLKKVDDNVTEFRAAIDKLRAQRHATTADLKLAELKLLVLYQEYQLLQTFEGRDMALQQKQLRCQGENSEILGNMKDIKTKLDAKIDELKVWSEKSNSLQAELRALLPESHPYLDPLSKIFKKKIKRNKAGEADLEEDDDDDDNEDDDDEDEEEVEDICPPGCDPAMYDKVLDLREKRLDIEETSAEIQKGIDDLKKTNDRLKQREKQILKDSLQTESEVQQFQLQKQAALNQIEVFVPLRLSQLYAFEGSGVATGPSDVPRGVDVADSELAATFDTLRDVSRRSVVSQIDIKSHVLFNKKSLVILDDRIGELHKECEESRVSFKELHKERVRLSKEREARQGEIDALVKRCNDLQMLKFGRVIDLDDLEAGSDRTKEEEAEEVIKSVEEGQRMGCYKLAQEIEAIQDKLAEATIASTALLSKVGELTEAKLQLSRDLNNPGLSAAQDIQGDDLREKAEHDRILTYVQLQAREIESLRAEITMFKRKETPPVIVPALPYSSASHKYDNTNSDALLPPIPLRKSMN